MRVSLDRALFAGEGGDPLLLASVFGHAVTGRHRVIVEPEAEEAFRAWGQLVGTSIFDRCQWALEQSVIFEALEPSEHQLVVASVATSDWSVNPPVLTLEDGVDLLERTFLIVVEDHLSDRDFLLSVATPEIRADLRERLGREWVKFEHGGGLGSMINRVKALSADPGASRLLWVVFDSDAVVPGRPSTASEELEALCRSRALGRHRLRRRAAENYLPKPALESWAATFSPSGLRPQKKRLARAFGRLSAMQRAYYNMKRGFVGDQDHEHAPLAEAHYDDVSGPDRATLASGFGPRISSLFSDLQGDERVTWFQRELVHAEFTPVFQQLLRAIR